MNFLLIILAAIAFVNADVSHLFGAGPSNSYLPPQREPHHRYGPPQPQVPVNTNSDIPESFFRLDGNPSVQSNFFRKPAQNYGPPTSGLGQSNVEVHFIQLPRQNIQSIATYAPSNQYLPPQQTYRPPRPIYTQPAPVYRPPTPVFQPQPIYRPQTPIYRQPAPVFQPQPIYRQPTPIYQQPIYRQPIAQPIPQPLPIPQPVPIPQPGPVEIPQPLPFPQPAPEYRQPSYHTTINYTPSNQYLPPVNNQPIESESVASQQPIPTFQPPSNEYLPPIEAKKVYITGQISQPAIQISQPSGPAYQPIGNEYIPPPVPQQIPNIPSYTEPEAAHTFGPTGYNYRRP